MILLMSHHIMSNKKEGVLHMHPLIHQCPVCEHALHATKLQCKKCKTTIENNFSLSKFATLSKEQLHFAEVFLVSRGNIKEVEKALNISYPTVRSRLNEVIAQLGYEQEEEPDRKKEIIDQLDSGEISFERAMELLKN